MYELQEVLIETTRICNMNCMHCGSDCNHRPGKDEMSVLEMKNVLLQLSDLGVNKIVFSGGEPTLKEGFEEMLISSAQLGIKTGFISNGLVPFSESLRSAMKEANLFAVGLSVDGLKDTHNKIRRCDMSWTGLMQNISILQDLEIEVCAVTTLSRLNYHEMPRIAKFLDMAEVDSWQVQLVMPSGRINTRSDLLLTEDDFKAICNYTMMLKSLHPNLKIQAADCFGLAPPDTIRSGTWSGCTAGLNSLAIDASGYIMPCLSIQSSARLENFRKKSIEQIWENSKMFDFNRKFDSGGVTGKCAGCTYLDQCRGGCASQSLSYYGYPHSSPFCFTRSFCKSN